MKRLRLSFAFAMVILSGTGLFAQSALGGLSGFSNYVGDFKATAQFENRGRDAILTEVECRWDFQAGVDGKTIPSIRWGFGDGSPISNLMVTSAAGNPQEVTAWATGEWGLVSNMVCRVAADGMVLEGKGSPVRILLQSLHAERTVMKVERRVSTDGSLQKWMRVGMTRIGSPTASDNPGGQECLITGGQGTRSVTFQGKTYFVCCGGCLDTFNRDPAKAVKEFEERAKMKK